MIDWLGSLPVTDIALALICGGVARPCQRAVYALVASRIVDPAAVEDPDGYDDGLMLYRIEALHRRLT